MEQIVRRRAYELYEQRGREDGHAQEDWMRAEAEVVGTALRRAKSDSVGSPDEHVRRQNSTTTESALVQRALERAPSLLAVPDELIGETMNKTILCIDDADPVLQLYGRIFEEQGTTRLEWVGRAGCTHAPRLIA
jgi:hypothetical protein